VSDSRVRKTGIAITVLGLVGGLLTGAPLLSGPLAAQASTAADPHLLEVIDIYTGVAGQLDDDRARALLLDVAEDRDDVLAQMWIARVYSRGRMGFERDEARARDMAGDLIDDIRALAAAGDVEAIFLMGTAYDEGLGVDVDYAEAVRWYRRSAAENHVLGAHNLGNTYRDGRGVDIDHATAVKWWLRAARAGDATTQLRLGEAFEAGRGVEQNLDRARYWYGRSAESGNSAAAVALERLSSK